jgi:hypothetical protein
VAFTLRDNRGSQHLALDDVSRHAGRGVIGVHIVGSPGVTEDRNCGFRVVHIPNSLVAVVLRVTENRNWLHMAMMRVCSRVAVVLRADRGSQRREGPLAWASAECGGHPPVVIEERNRMCAGTLCRLETRWWRPSG